MLKFKVKMPSISVTLQSAMGNTSHNTTMTHRQMDNRHIVPDAYGIAVT